MYPLRFNISLPRIVGSMLPAALMLFAVVFAVGTETLVSGQGRNVNQARARIRDRMIQEQG